MSCHRQANPTVEACGRTRRAAAVGLLLAVALGSWLVPAPAALAEQVAWSASERALLESLWLGSLPPRPRDPSNKHADSPRAARLGRNIFFDQRFSADGSVSCGTCHLPEYDFTDRLRRAKGMGQVRRRTMPLIGMAYQDWFFWDGRKDSLWSQALDPPENPVEHGITRTRCAQLVAEHYSEEYEAEFGTLPLVKVRSAPADARPAADAPAARRAWEALSEAQRQAINRVYANMGKAIAAYVRTLMPSESRFDRYVEAVLDGRRDGAGFLSAEEVAGLRVFLGKGKCANCHNGPLFTNADFHFTGVAGDPEPDLGRAEGIPLVLADEFSCLGPYSDADPASDCAHVRFMDDDVPKYRGAFKTPTLRNVAEHPPYMHGGQHATLLEVLEFYRDAAREGVADDLEHVDLADAELGPLVAFLRTLSAPIREVPAGP